jgi:thioredoxin 1
MDILNDKQFETEVLKSSKPVIVDFWAEWCGPCKMYSPIIEEVAKEFENKVKLVKVNVDENEALAAKYNISSIPTTILVENGNIKASFVGAVPKEWLKKWLNSKL